MKRIVMENTTSPGTAADDGRVVASIRADGVLSIEFEGWMQDVDGASYPPRRSVGGVEPTQLVLMCEALATGTERAFERSAEGRTWRWTWTFEAPRDYPQPSALTDRHLWFFPMTEDWFAFSMRTGALLAALPVEVRWLLSQLPAQHVERAKLELALVLLDAAMVRCGG